MVELEDLMEKSSRSAPEQCTNEESESRGRVPREGHQTVHLYLFSPRFFLYQNRSSSVSSHSDLLWTYVEVGAVSSQPPD